LEKFFKSIFKKVRLNESTLSMILGALVVVVIGVLIFNYFAKTEEQVVVEGEVSEFGEMVIKEEGTTPDGLPSKHTVAKGEHLWEIAEKYYDSGYNWVDIAEANNLDDARSCFRHCHELLNHLKQIYGSRNHPLNSAKYLSMGMSGDFEVAIEEGSHYIRIGTALFGERNYGVTK